MNPNRSILAIGGTDPCSGAGVTADLQVFRDFELHGVSVITAVAWQNTSEVLGFRALEPDEVWNQWRALVDDGIEIAAIKIGMLPTKEIVEVVERIVDEYEGPTVFDPVIKSGSGNVRLASGESLRTLVKKVDVVTPNLPEATALIGTASDVPSLAAMLRHVGCKAVLLKAGHLPSNGELIKDYWADAKGSAWMAPLKRQAVDVHGTGCQLSSAVAAGLAWDMTPLAAAERAREYLNCYLGEARHIGAGRAVVLRTPKLM